MSFFSIGYAEKERIEFIILEAHKRSPVDPIAWARAQVKVILDRFSGEAEIFLEIDDLVRFKTELEQMNKDVAGAAHFTTREYEIEIRLKMDRLGHVEASGFLGDLRAVNKLSFEFSYDQTLLAHTIAELNQVLTEIL